MRVLILSVTAGEGHNSCAAALREALERRGHEVKVADLYRSCGIPRRLTEEIYLICARCFRSKYRRVYTRMERDEAFRRKWEKRFLPDWLYPRAAAFLQGQEADCVVAMHVFAARLLTVLHRQGLISVPILGVNTDYCLHPYWEDCPGLDGLVIPDATSREDMLSRGVPPEILKPLGIPIRSPERYLLTRKETRGSLGLPEGKCILLMGGSMGYGRIFSTALALRRQEATTVCVCGKNRGLYLLLKPFQNRRLKVLGFIQNLPVYMRAADLAVTKPGGLSLAELAAAGLPVLLTRPIPGHEERNLRLWTGLGAAASAASCRSGREIAALAMRLSGDGEALARMRGALEGLRDPQAAENLCSFVETLDKAAVHD